jgi:hypothetical protein
MLEPREAERRKVAMLARQPPHPLPAVAVIPPSQVPPYPTLGAKPRSGHLRNR